jgi:hypothetical protein
VIASQRTSRRGPVKGFVRPPNADFYEELTPKAERRFWSKVRKKRGADACWLWVVQPRRDGYSQMWLGSRYVLAHRLSWALARGRFDQRLSVLHRCDNPRCVRPSHLFLGTQGDNMRDAARKGRTRSAPPTPPERVEWIRHLARSGVRVASIAARYGLTIPAVYHIISGRRKGSGRSGRARKVGAA